MGPRQPGRCGRDSTTRPNPNLEWSDRGYRKDLVSRRGCMTVEEGVVEREREKGGRNRMSFEPNGHEASEAMERGGVMERAGSGSKPDEDGSGLG
jgi:hypothetical protein